MSIQCSFHFKLNAKCKTFATALLILFKFLLIKNYDNKRDFWEWNCSFLYSFLCFVWLILMGFFFFVALISIPSTFKLICVLHPSSFNRSFVVFVLFRFLFSTKEFLSLQCDPPIITYNKNWKGNLSTTVLTSQTWFINREESDKERPEHSKHSMILIKYIDVFAQY